MAGLYQKPPNVKIGAARRTFNEASEPQLNICPQNHPQTARLFDRFVRLTITAKTLAVIARNTILMPNKPPRLSLIPGTGFRSKKKGSINEFASVRVFGANLTKPADALNPALIPSALLTLRWDSVQNETLRVADEAEHSILSKDVTHQ